MAAKPESALANRIKTEVLGEYPGSWIVKIHGSAFQTAGIPDLVGCIEGRFIGIEVKVPGREDTLTARQEDALRRLRRAGALAFMSSSVEHALATLSWECR